MKRLTSAIAFLLLSCSACLAQTASVKPAFDAASVKISLNQTPSGGLGTLQDAGRVTFGKITLHDLLFRAYDLHFDYQMSGPEWLFAPWLSATKLEVVATFPPSSTEATIRLMLQSMLEERFNLRVHQETKDRSIYDLAVASGGLKLKESERKPRIIDGKEIMPTTAVGCTVQGTRGFAVPMSQIALHLANELGTVVNDKTGLTGLYDFQAENFNGDATPVPGQTSCPIAPALEGFGLKLEKRKGSVDILVIDQVDREPTAN